jgi:hypothetical protein
MTDSITIFLPAIGADEYKLRARLNELQRIAAALIGKTECETARWLAQFCSEYATAFIYASVEQDVLTDIGRFCHRLLVAAMQAEAISDRMAHRD